MVYACLRTAFRKPCANVMTAFTIHIQSDTELGQRTKNVESFSIQLPSDTRRVTTWGTFGSLFNCFKFKIFKEPNYGMT